MTTAAIAVTALAAACLGGCSTNVSSADAASREPATPEVIAAAASAVRIAPGLVFTTAVEGYDLAPQSVGRGAADGMSATWFNDTSGAMLTIRTEHGHLTAESCASTPLWDAPEEVVTCTEQDDLWHRSGAGIHEYVTVRGDASVWITGANGAATADLLAAAEAVRVPTEAELELLLSDLPDTSAEPVERGDLPEHGDGAPIDPVGEGG